MSLLSEILEQPAVLEKQLKEQKANVCEIAAQIKKNQPEFLYMIARGTSDHASIYGQYLFGIMNRIPTVFSAPSMSTFYGSGPCVKNALSVAISQSGKSPDLVITAADAKKQGSRLLVVTNTPASPLGEEADYLIDCMAGPEKATAATKSYTTSLMAFAMLSAALKDDPQMWADLEKVPGWVEEMFKYEETLEALAERYVHAPRCVVLGRGFNFATAKEWGLKMQELTYIMAEPYSSAVFEHGPIAMVETNFPVFNIAVEGAVLESQLPQIAKLRDTLGADVVTVTNNQQAADLSSRSIMLPAGIPEWLTPIVAIIPAQILARGLACARGWDIENPRSIHKVTETH